MKYCGLNAPRSDLIITHAMAHIPADVKLAMYRMAAEALTNAGRHAHADLVSVSLRSEADDSVVLTIYDDGEGFDVDLTPQGQGLSSLRDRALLIGADLQISSPPNSGATVTIRWSRPGEPEDIYLSAGTSSHRGLVER